MLRMSSRHLATSHEYTAKCRGMLVIEKNIFPVPHHALLKDYSSNNYMRHYLYPLRQTVNHHSALSFLIVMQDEKTSVLLMSAHHRNFLCVIP